MVVSAYISWLDYLAINLSVKLCQGTGSLDVTSCDFPFLAGGGGVQSNSSNLCDCPDSTLSSAQYQK